VGPTWCWAQRRCFGAVVVISVHAPANHCREGSLRDGCCRAPPGAEFYHPRLAATGLDTGSTRVQRARVSPQRPQNLSQRTARGAQDACCARGVHKSGVLEGQGWGNKVDGHMPWGALSGSRRFLGHKRVFWGRGGGFRASARWSNTCNTYTQYIHILSQTTYLHIPNMPT
jgi:hypothetical protein